MSNSLRANAVQMALGLIVIAFGIGLLLDRAGVAASGVIFRFWPLGLVLIGLGVIVQASAPIEPGDARKPLQFPLGAAFWLVVLGFTFSHVSERRAAAQPGSGQLHVFAIMSGDRRTVIDEPFTGGDSTAVMGGSQIDLRKAIMAPGARADLDIFAVMGGTVVYVPAGWVVDVQTTAMMGGIKDERRKPTSSTSRQTSTSEQSASPSSGVSASGPKASADPALPAGDVERPDVPAGPSGGSSAGSAAAAPSTSGSGWVPAPRLVLRGMVLMGGLTIRS